MKVVAALLAASALMVGGSAQADEALVKSVGCIGCHAMDAKKVGPSWKEIASKASEADVIAAINNGVKGKYGKIPMAPQAQAKAKAADIAKWIVSLK